MNKKLFAVGLLLVLLALAAITQGIVIPQPYALSQNKAAEIGLLADGNIVTGTTYLPSAAGIDLTYFSRVQFDMDSADDTTTTVEALIGVAYRLKVASAAGDTVIRIDTKIITREFQSGISIQVGDETATVLSVSGDIITLAAPLANSHIVGTQVINNDQWYDITKDFRDLELSTTAHASYITPSNWAIINTQINFTHWRLKVICNERESCNIYADYRAR